MNRKIDFNRKRLSTHHYNRVNMLCLGILLICIVVFAIAYLRRNHDMQIFCFGGISASGLILVALNPIEGN